MPPIKTLAGESYFFAYIFFKTEILFSKTHTQPLSTFFDKFKTSIQLVLRQKLFSQFDFSKPFSKLILFLSCDYQKLLYSLILLFSQLNLCILALRGRLNINQIVFHNYGESLFMAFSLIRVFITCVLVVLNSFICYIFLEIFFTLFNFFLWCFIMFD